MTTEQALNRFSVEKRTYQSRHKATAGRFITRTEWAVRDTLRGGVLLGSFETRRAAEYDACVRTDLALTVPAGDEQEMQWQAAQAGI